jgi:hypothetical protein
VFEEHLQHIAEQLARDLRRSVIIDDAALRPLAITPQTGRLDRSRVEAVLQRQTSAGLRRKLAELGVFSAREPVRIPGEPRQATLPRLCLPLGNAQYAACVAARVPQFGRAADWASLGAYSAFQHLYCDRSTPERICPGVGALLDERAEMYRQTVRCYLECAAQAQQAAAQLHIHRTTLYWRLARAAELMPLDLRRGEDRLRLHLALTLADLTHPAGPVS